MDGHPKIQDKMRFSRGSLSTAPTRLKGYTVRASKEEPQYVIESDKTDHVAVHKGSALRKLRGAAAGRGV